MTVKIVEQEITQLDTKLRQLLNEYESTHAQLLEWQYKHDQLAQDNERLREQIRLLQTEYHHKIEQYVRMIDEILSK